MEYEETLADIDKAVKRGGSSDEVRRHMDRLNLLSREIKNQKGLAAYLERGRFGSAARDRLQKEYVRRYIMLRGGGPTDAFPADGASADGRPNESVPLLGEDGFLTEFTDTAVRHGFVQKVYGILCVQLIVTTIVAAGVMALLKEASPALVTACFFMSLSIMIGTMCACYCDPSLMKTYPTNYGLLFLFTVAESILVGFVGTRYTQESVLIVTGVTALVVLSLSLFACQTSMDFSGYGPYLMCALMVMCGFSFCFMIAALLGFANTPAFQAVRLVYACCGALLFSFYIVYDTQLIMGGKHQNMFAIDDYCMAALSLYMDIISLFLYLLKLFGDRR